MKIKAKFQNVLAVIAEFAGIARNVNETDAEYEYCVFFDVANDTHALEHRSLSLEEGFKITKIERWNENQFVEVAA